MARDPNITVRPLTRLTVTCQLLKASLAFCLVAAGSPSGAQSCGVNQHWKGAGTFSYRNTLSSNPFPTYNYATQYRSPNAACQAFQAIYLTNSGIWEHVYQHADPVTGNFLPGTIELGNIENPANIPPPPPPLPLRSRYAGTNFDAQYHCLHLEQGYGDSPWPFYQYVYLDRNFGLELYQNGRCEDNCSAGYVNSPITGLCIPGEKNLGDQCGNSTPFPINAATGNKYWTDSDYESVNEYGVRFERFYNSLYSGDSGEIGFNWLHSYSSHIDLSPVNPNDLVMTKRVTVRRPSGVGFDFLRTGNVYLPTDAAVMASLVEVVDGQGVRTGWQYTDLSTGSVETFDPQGRLLSVLFRNGVAHTLTYSTAATPQTVAPNDGLLIAVADSFGRQLTFKYTRDGRVDKMIAPGTREYQYAYDADGNLLSVTGPDSAVRGYLYNEPSLTGGADLRYALTGVVDENGTRFATYSYDALGRSTAGEHAGGVDRYQLVFNADGTTAVTDPKGSTRTRSFQTILGAAKGTFSDQPAGSGCGAATAQTSYDVNGNVASRVDFNGVQSTYVFDLGSNLEQSRIEAAGTAQARKISTEWSPTLRLPTRVAEPNRITTYTYDAGGNILSKSVQPTTDTNGAQGFAAPTSGAPQTMSYTYNALGQRLSATGPRTDIATTTTYQYDMAGSLVTVTDPAGRITTLSNYDADGRAWRIVDPNGIVNDRSYDNRGRLTSSNLSAGGTTETTTFTYDPSGQLRSVTAPTGATVTFNYDGAHRLTSIVDGAGNSVVYTLDAMGNRIGETARDPGGVLSRQITRLYDALNRLQQLTGVQQ